MEWLKLWWRQSDHYDRLSAHLRARDMDGITRTTIAVIAGGLAVVTLATIWTTNVPQRGVPLACTLIATLGAAGGALVWALRWPSRVAAIRFVMAATGSIGLIALSQGDPVLGVLTCASFAATASYIALFHTAPLLAFHFAVASAVASVECFRLASTYNIVTGLSVYGLLLFLDLGVPFGVQVVVHVLSSDAVRAERDQLTGLLTRQAFHRLATASLEQGSQRRDHIVITMIDLDRFKQLNDSHGHSAGDDALVSVARALRGTTDDTAVIGRLGGEEFVIADIWHPDEVSRRAQQLCEEIAASPSGITASIGTAGIYPAYRTDASADVLRELLAAADAAMYAAKRRGGNQVEHHDWPLPPPLDRVDDDETGYRSRGISA